MKLRTSLVALVAFITGVIGAVVLPALAQQTEIESAWEVTVSRPNQVGIVVFVKHDRVTGKALVLTCINKGITCSNKKTKWLELAVEVVE